MPTYVVLVNWTEQGLENVKETVERTDRGTEFKQAFWTVGPYDMVAVFESPDDETLSAHLLEICASGSVRTTTMRAYDREEMSGILQRLD